MEKTHINIKSTEIWNKKCVEEYKLQQTKNHI